MKYMLSIANHTKMSLKNLCAQAHSKVSEDLQDFMTFLKYVSSVTRKILNFMVYDAQKSLYFICRTKM